MKKSTHLTILAFIIILFQSSCIEVLIAALAYEESDAETETYESGQGKNDHSSYDEKDSSEEYLATEEYNDFNIPSAGKSDEVKEKSYILSGLRSTFSNDYTRWSISGSPSSGSLNATFSSDIDSWNLSFGEFSSTIRSTFSNDYYSWNMGNISIRTVFSSSFSDWTVSDSKTTIRVRSTFSNDYDSWEISGPQGSMRVRSTFSNSYDAWDIDDNMPEENPQLKVAAVFACLVPVIVTDYKKSKE